MKRIIALLDFSPLTESVFETAINMGLELACEVLFLHRLERGERLEMQADERFKLIFSKEEKKEPYPSLNQYFRRANSSGIKYSWQFFGDEIGDFLIGQRYTGYDNCIVLGASGLGKKSFPFWGSTTERVLEQIPGLVLVLKNDVFRWSADNIVFASSFDESETEGFRQFIKAVPLNKDAVLHLLYVDTMGMLAPPSASVLEAIGRFQASLSGWSSQVHLFSDYSVEAGIRHFAEQVGADLLVMGLNGNKKLEHVFKGNDVIDLAHHIEVPILAFPIK